MIRVIRVIRISVEAKLKNYKLKKFIKDLDYWRFLLNLGNELKCWCHKQCLAERMWYMQLSQSNAKIFLELKLFIVDICIFMEWSSWFLFIRLEIMNNSQWFIFVPCISETTRPWHKNIICSQFQCVKLFYLWSVASY